MEHPRGDHRLRRTSDPGTRLFFHAHWQDADAGFLIVIAGPSPVQRSRGRNPYSHTLTGKPLAAETVDMEPVNTVPVDADGPLHVSRFPENPYYRKPLKQAGRDR